MNIDNRPAVERVRLPVAYREAGDRRLMARRDGLAVIYLHLERR
ncbi:hypothetical protein ACQP2F_13915 [Actinoplanes sp. CA-030573]